MTKKKKVALVTLGLSALSAVVKILFDIEVPVPDGLVVLLSGLL